MIFDPFYDMLQARKKKVTQAASNWARDDYREPKLVFTKRKNGFKELENTTNIKLVWRH